jgi:hypothetical protein
LGKLLSWNRFWRCTVKIWENSQNVLLICDFLCTCPSYCLTFISFALFDLSNKRFSKNRSLPAVLFWHISTTICVCILISFFLSSFDHGTFEEVATVSYALMGVILELKLNQSVDLQSWGCPCHPKKYPRGTSIKA